MQAVRYGPASAAEIRDTPHEQSRREKKKNPVFESKARSEPEIKKEARKSAQRDALKKSQKEAKSAAEETKELSTIRFEKRPSGPVLRHVSAAGAYALRQVDSVLNRQLGETQSSEEEDAVSAASVRRASQVVRTQSQKEIRDEGRSPVKEKTANKEAAAGEAEQQRKRRKKKQQSAGRKKKGMEQTAKETAEAAETTGKTVEEAGGKVKKFVSEHPVGVLIVLLLFPLLAFLGAAVSACSALAGGAGSSIVMTTWPAEDGEMQMVEHTYAEWEAELQAELDGLESDWPGYTDYIRDTDQIYHTPQLLISYFCARYGAFTFSEIEDELREIFEAQYNGTGRPTYDAEQAGTSSTIWIKRIGNVRCTVYCACGRASCSGSHHGENNGRLCPGETYVSANHSLAIDMGYMNSGFNLGGVHIQVGNGSRDGSRVILQSVTDPDKLVKYVVEDVGNFARYGTTFDICVGDTDEAHTNAYSGTWHGGYFDVFVETTSDDPEAIQREVWYYGGGRGRLTVTLVNNDLDTILRSRMTPEETIRYELYISTGGNRSDLFGSSMGFGYEIPPAALTDERFANMWNEARKYLGMPYVWGGSSPSTSFDCSGFVCWVVNHCGNGWNVGRTTAEGLRQMCAYVSPSAAKPGDLIFFQGTYDTPGASHVGIYIGDGKMVHCGNPVAVADITSSYWQQHFMAYGRLAV